MKYTINLRSIKCVEEINEGSASEEPYVLVTAVELTTLVPGLPRIADCQVFLYGAWEGVDKGETRNNSGAPFWGLFSASDDILTTEDVIFIVSMMEQDNGSPRQYRTFVKAAATASLASTPTQSRAVRAATLLRDISDALNGIDLPIPFALDDDHIGSAELRLRARDLITSGSRDIGMRIRSREGFYDLMFRITAVPG